MLLAIWNEILFRPLLNILIGLYNTIGLQNLGFAIVWLTLLTRITLLPFSLNANRQRQKKILIQQELQSLARSYANNPSVLREEQRQLFKQYNFRRWPKILSLAVQGLILLVLYQVFVGGIKLGEIVDFLYPWVHVPATVNTIFLGIDIAKRSFILSILPALLLGLSIVIDHGGVKKRWTPRDLLLLFGFPFGTFLALYFLPSVKAIFVLVSLIFTLTLRIMTNFFTAIAYQEKLISEKKQQEAEERMIGIPHPKDRFK